MFLNIYSWMAKRHLKLDLFISKFLNSQLPTSESIPPLVFLISVRGNSILLVVQVKYLGSFLTSSLSLILTANHIV